MSGHVDFEPPGGSRISVTRDGAHSLIAVPHGDGGQTRYFVGPFLLAWLAGWAVGFGSTVSMLLSGQVPAFLAVWLIGWTLAGAGAAYLAYPAFRPAVPESLRLMPNTVTYDSGIPPLPSLQTYWGSTSFKDLWKDTR